MLPCFAIHFCICMMLLNLTFLIVPWLSSKMCLYVHTHIFKESHANRRDKRTNLAWRWCRPIRGSNWRQPRHQGAGLYFGCFPCGVFWMQLVRRRRCHGPASAAQGGISWNQCSFQFWGIVMSDLNIVETLVMNINECSIPAWKADSTWHRYTFVTGASSTS